MASKLGDEKRLVSTLYLLVAQSFWPRKTMWLLSSYRHHHWSGGKFENASENAGRNSLSEGAYASLCAEFDIDPATSATVGIFHHLECLESRKYTQQKKNCETEAIKETLEISS